MITRAQYIHAQKIGEKLIQNTGIYINVEEFEQISVADFGLSNIDLFGAYILTLVNTNMIAAKLIAMHPLQILPEHWHPKNDDYIGKEETLRVEWGQMYFYSSGKPGKKSHAIIPEDKINCFNNWHETIMNPGDQISLQPTVPHWFQAGEKGVVVWSFSTKALDLQDEFTDPQIRRETIIIDSD